MTRVKRVKTGEGVDFVICKLCLRSYKAISAPHLVAKHDFDPDHPVREYMDRFRLRVASSQNTLAKRRVSCIATLRSQGRHLSRTETLRMLRQERHAGRPLNGDPVRQRNAPLFQASRRLFGTWLGALQAAGLTPDRRIRTPIWSRERVLDEIRSLPSSVPLNKVAPRNPSLFGASQRYCGGWKEAVKDAGRRYPPIGGAWKWTRENILSEMRSLARRGCSIKPSHVDRILPGLVSAARGLFGTWRAASKTAGIERKLPPEKRHWTKQELLVLFQNINSKHGSISRRILNGIRRPGFMTPVASIQRHYQTITRALVESGLPSKLQAHLQWKKESVILAIKSRVRQGLDLRLKTIQKVEGLGPAGKLHFGSWRAAVEVAGAGHLLGPTLNRWDREKIAEEIRRLTLHKRSIDKKDIRRSQNALFLAANRYFGSWEAAVEFAGLSRHLTPKPRHWSRREILELFKGLVRRRGRLKSEEVKAYKRPGYVGPLFSITRLFGTFLKAKKAALKSIGCHLG